MSDPKITPPTTKAEPIAVAEKDEKPEKGGKRSAWMTHVKATMKSHKGMKLAQVLKLAKKTYKKPSKRGGAVVTPAPVGGRRTRKTRRGGRKH